MKSYKLIIIILVIFVKSGNVLSNEKIFNVNNIEITKTPKMSNEFLASKAIKVGYIQLMEKILLSKDMKKVSDLNFKQIKELVSYYQVIEEENTEKENTIKFNIFFDKDKLHKLFFQRGILYSEIIQKELFILPILKKNDQLYVFNNNFFYENWNKVYSAKLIEFVLLLENIEVIQEININKNSLLDLNIRNLFKEYTKKNLALILIEEIQKSNYKVYLRTNILGKKIDKNLVIEKLNLSKKDYEIKIINEVSREIINFVKSQNLIDIRVPSFLNAKLSTSKVNNLVELNKRIKKIDSIDSIYVQEFNKKNVFLKIKYLGKLDKIMKQLEAQRIILKLIGDQWSLKLI